MHEKSHLDNVRWRCPKQFRMRLAHGQAERPWNVAGQPF
jgi:hypothetical protein